jgi:hypothetical protein
VGTLKVPIELDKILLSIDSFRELGETSRKVLKALAAMQDGYPKNGIANSLAPITCMDSKDTQMLITDLISCRLIIEVNQEGGAYYKVNYSKILGEDNDFDIIGYSEMGIEILGSPLSRIAMTTLENIFRTEKGPIYVGLSVTGVKIFKDMLEQRSRSVMKTIFFYPSKAHIPKIYDEIYSETLNEWRKYLLNADKLIQKNIQLRLMKKPEEPLHVSLVSKSKCRFLVKNNDEFSSRIGTLISVDAGTTIYEVIKNQMTDMYKNSIPDARIYPWVYIWEKMKTFYFPIFAVLFSLLTILCVPQPFEGIGLAIIAVFVTDIIIKQLHEKKWVKKDLF